MMNLANTLEITESTANASDPAQSTEAQTIAHALEDVWPRWKRVLWTEGMRPMYLRMLELDHTMSEHALLQRLHRQKLSVSEVAEELAITPSAASRAVDRLVRDGLVSRHECAHDRRQRELALTPQGEQLMHDVGKEFSDKLLAMVGSLTLDEQHEFLRLLQRMIDNFESAHS